MDGQRLVSVQPCNHFTLISAPTSGKAHDRANGCLQVGSWEKMTRVDMMEISYLARVRQPKLDRTKHETPSSSRKIRAITTTII